MIQFLEQLIEESDWLQIHKTVNKGFISCAKESEEQRKNLRKLIEETSDEKRLDEIILSTDEVIIYTIHSKQKSLDDWDVKYPFRSIYFKNEKWNRMNTVSPSLDVALLCYLECKHLDSNSRFTDFALKMLEIKI